METRSIRAIFSKGERRHAEVPHHVAGEVGRGREREVLRNPPHGDVLLKKQSCDLARGEEVDEVAGAPAAHPAADFREIFGRDEKFLCIPGEVPVLAKGPVGKFADEAPKEQDRPGGDGDVGALEDRTNEPPAGIGFRSAVR